MLVEAEGSSTVEAGVGGVDDLVVVTRLYYDAIRIGYNKREVASSNIWSRELF